MARAVMRFLMSARGVDVVLVAASLGTEGWLVLATFFRTFLGWALVFALMLGTLVKVPCR